MLLTIGIPTHDRVAAITQHVKSLVAASVPDIVRVLVIDNASTDGTLESLSRICDGTCVRLLRNERNLGYRGNFLRLFEECQTEYLLVTSDEDPVIRGHLGALLQFLERRRPMLVSPQYFRREEPDRIFRGVHVTQRVAPAQFKACSFHMPGLVYKTRESKEVIRDFRTYLERKELAAFPQVLLAAGLILRGPCFFWDKPIVFQEYVYPHQHGDSNYNHLPQRWEQYNVLWDALADNLERCGDSTMRRVATSMLEGWREGLFEELRGGIYHDRPDLLPNFDGQARAWYGLRRPLGIICKMLFRHPVANWRALRMGLREWNSRRVSQRSNGSGD
jgi:glycosyltransferase involved in cell wall biosynthesis